MSDSFHYFVCGIGGSGMLPLAIILKGLGFKVSGSDRSYDQGRTPEKFQWIKEQGIALHPQDGSGITKDIDVLVISKAVEDTIPDIGAAKGQNIPIQKRVDVLIEFFNKAKVRIAISGTSGKTTTTGMAGFLLKEAGLNPTVMNGGIFRNYIHENPYSTAFVGNGDVFVTEVDESDGKEAVCGYQPDIAVIHNISLDHQPLPELKEMFSGFLSRTKMAVLNADDPNVSEVAAGFAGQVVTYGLKMTADFVARDIVHHQDGISAQIERGGECAALRLRLPGKHNISNALAAIAAAHAAGIPLSKTCDILSRFEGIRRRMEVVGTKNAITVMDDFAHNPDKLAATLGTLHEFPGRLLIFFQPHGYGFLKLVGPDLAKGFADHMRAGDRLYMVEPFYAGGTVDRSIGSQHIIDEINTLLPPDAKAYLMEGRDEIGESILNEARAGDRIIIMGARDDTLSDFAHHILASLP